MLFVEIINTVMEAFGKIDNLAEHAPSTSMNSYFQEATGGKCSSL